MNPDIDDNKSGQTSTVKEREELRLALVAAQESAAVQMLLECCLPMNEQEKVDGTLYVFYHNFLCTPDDLCFKRCYPVIVVFAASVT